MKVDERGPSRLGSLCVWKGVHMNVPNHIAIILDGNGRWAKAKGMPASFGHKEGAKTLEKIVRYANKIGLEYITVYAFSTENWKRPAEEVDRIMQLLDQMIDDSFEEFMAKKVRIRFLGDRSRIPQPLLVKMDKVTEMSKEFDDTTLYIALNYGGRQEIVSSVKRIAQQCVDGKLNVSDIDTDTVGDNLYYDDFKDVDLIIRPSGEQRLSNFLLWQSAYAELWYSNVLWPDFKPEHLERAIYDYQKRNRRFGGI